MQDRIEDGEERWQTFGLVGGVLLLMVAHTVHEITTKELIRIIAGGTNTLTKTPAARPEDSLLIEARNVELPGYGPSHVTVTSTTEGDIDSFYRAVYGGAENKQVRENLAENVRNTYDAKALASVEQVRQRGQETRTAVRPRSWKCGAGYLV